MGDWMRSYHEQLVDRLKPPKNRLPSESTLRRALLHIDCEQYSACLANFFDVKPRSGETIALDGKLLRGSYLLEDDNPNSDSHPAIMLVSAYIVERGLILEPFQVNAKTNEIKALPPLIQKLALRGVVFAFDAINTQKKLVQ